MWYYGVKVFVSALIIVIVTEVSKKSTRLAAFLVSLPLTSLLAFLWLYFEGEEVEKISELSEETLWLVIPSLLFFVVFPFCIKKGWGFSWSFSVGVFVTSGAYALTLYFRS